MSAADRSPEAGRYGQRRFLLLAGLLLAAGLGLRLLVMFCIPTQPVSDFWSYFQRAVSLADRGVYEAIAGRADASYPPGYPLLLSLFFRLPFERLATARAVNLALAGVTIVLAALLGRRLFGDPASLLAAALLAFYPRSILQVLLIASENLFTPLLLAWLLVMLSPAAQRRCRLFFLGGLLLGALCLVRSVAWLLVIPWAVSQIPSRPPLRLFLARLCLLLAAQALVLLPWALRNDRVLGSPTFLTTTGGIDLFIGNNPQAPGYWYPWLEDMKEIDPGFSTLTPVEQDRTALKAAVAWMRANPLDAARLYAGKLYLMIRDDYFILETTMFGDQISPPWPAASVLPAGHPVKAFQPFLRVLVDASFWMLMLLEAAGAAACLSKWNNTGARIPAWLLPLLVAAYFPIVSAVFHVSSRLIWPSVDLLLPFAGHGLALFYPWMQRKIRRPGPGTS